ncbi:Ig kappa chain V region 3547 [Anabarilius grahami]|uniref:Ig kappa chain V region 3547 n=1 Tax=Anabarilius grahami TaxID=495550 RepID=A0A3N0YLM4_ANAGA|nr:Ig kappa chain V region 3547 [Anabarilius grahami]
MIPWAFVAVLCIICSAQHHRIHQPNKVITVALGNTVTLQCYARGDNIFWYKQKVGQQPRVISVFFKLSGPIFYNEFKNDRFWGKRLGSNSNLTISSITQSDEAVYYCGLRTSYIEFGSGTHLITKVQGSGQDNQVRGQSNAQDENVSYAALRFSRKKNKSGGKRGQSLQTMIVYTSDSLNV